MFHYAKLNIDSWVCSSPLKANLLPPLLLLLQSDTPTAGINIWKPHALAALSNVMAWDSGK